MEGDNPVNNLTNIVMMINYISTFSEKSYKELHQKVKFFDLILYSHLNSVRKRQNISILIKTSPSKLLQILNGWKEQSLTKEH